MRALAGRLALLAAPFALICGFVLHVLLASGELERVDDVIELQKTSARPVLFGAAYSDHTAYYKLHAVLSRRPTVIALGSSRVMAVRSALFRNEVAFYNAGSPLLHVGFFTEFLSRVPAGREPRLIVVGLDHWLFSAGWPRSSPAMPELSQGGPDPFKVLGNGLRKVVVDYLLGKYALADLARVKGDTVLIGMNAVVNRHGYRNDGSHRISAPGPQKQIHDDMLRDIVAGMRIFAPAKTISPESVEDLRRFLLLCQSKGIYVVGFLPAFTHRFYTALAGHDRYAYLRDLAPKLAPIFRDAGFAFFDFSDLAVVGASDAEAFDPVHISEKAYVRLFVEMARRDARLREVIADVGDLSARLTASRSDAYVFGE